MSRLFIDHNALELIKKELAKENAPAMRIFTSGGCCNRFEIAPVKKALAGDVTIMQGGVKVYMEKELAESASAIEIKFDEKKGLIIRMMKEIR
jgi:Fe-S cluster assembly iron-binding protein IscA